ncbi:MAG: hypothetical protein GY715_20425 [Planctomycetes bacterium]|nr:hypothetical protein [Planctomycetota bacterium]
MNTLLSLGVGGLLLTMPPADSNTTTGQETVTASQVQPTIDEYEIRMHRPAKVGQRMHVRGFGMQEQSTTASTNGRTKESKLHVDFEAEANVVAVNSLGRPIHVSYRVLKCEMTRDGNTTKIAAPGTTIVAREDKGSQTVFEIDGRPVGKDARKALKMVAGLDNEQMTDDEMLGTERPRVIGESWPVNRAMMARKFQQQSANPISPDDIAGATTLAGVTTQNGYPCLVLHSSITSENAVPGLNSVPPGFELEDGSMTMTIQRTLPKDAHLPSLSDAARMDLQFVLAGTSNNPTRMTCRFMQMVEKDVRMLSTSTGADDSMTTPILE